MNYQMESIRKQLFIVFVLHTLYKRIGYVIIPQPRFSSREDQLSLSQFRLVVFNMLAQSVHAMTTFNRPLLFSVRQLAGDRSTVTNGRSLLHSYIHAGDSVCTIVLGFFAYKKILGRTETRTRDMMYCQTIRSVRDIYRDDRGRIATCTLRTLIDIYIVCH